MANIIKINVVSDLKENTQYDVFLSKQTQCTKTYTVQKNFGIDNTNLVSFKTGFTLIKTTSKDEITQMLKTQFKNN